MNNVIVITGGGGVLCSCFAKELAKTGAPVAILDINYEKVEEVAKKIRDEGGIAKAYCANVLDRDSLEKIREEIHKDLGFCRVLINGAGGNNPKCTTDKEYYEEGDADDESIKSFFSLDKSGFDFVFDLNIKGTLLPTQVFARDMLSEDNCCILNISSMNAFTPLTKIPAYSAAKSAVSNFTQWLAVHFAKQNIRVNAIAPGFFVTAQNKALLFNDDGTPTPRTDKILRSTPMGRFGKPEELLGAVKWLIDEKEASFVTGVVIPIDGGFSAYSGV